MQRIHEEKLGWRQIKWLLDNGAGAELPQKTDTDTTTAVSGEPKVSHRETPKKGEGGSTAPQRDIERLQSLISDRIGYACKVSHNQQSRKVSLTFNVMLDDFEHLLANLKPVELND